MNETKVQMNKELNTRQTTRPAFFSKSIYCSYGAIVFMVWVDVYTVFSLI